MVDQSDNIDPTAAPPEEAAAPIDAGAVGFNPRRRSALRFQAPLVTVKEEGVETRESPSAQDASPAKDPQQAAASVAGDSVEKTAVESVTVVEDPVNPDLTRPADFPKATSPKEMVPEPKRGGDAPLAPPPSSVVTRPFAGKSFVAPTEGSVAGDQKADRASSTSVQEPVVEASKGGGAAPTVAETAESVPDFQDWLRQRQEALRKARERALRREEALGDAAKTVQDSASDSPKEVAERQEPVLQTIGSQSTANAAENQGNESKTAAAPIGFNPNRGKRSTAFNIPPPADAVVSTTPKAKAESTAAEEPLAASRAAPQDDGPNQAFDLNEAALGTHGTVEKVLSSTELIETPALKALKNFMDGKAPDKENAAAVAVKSKKSFFSIKKIRQRLYDFVFWAVSFLVLAGGWTLFVYGIMVLFIAINPIPFVDAGGNVLWSFDARYTSHWIGLRQYFNAGAVIPWSLVWAVVLAFCVWLLPGIALLKQGIQPTSSVFKRQLDRRWYQIKRLWRKPDEAEKVLLKTSMADIEGMLTQARKEAEADLKKRKVAAAGGTPGGSQANSMAPAGPSPAAMASAAASRGSGGNG